jgi:hypothetical protein
MIAEADIMHGHIRIGRILISNDYVLASREAGLAYILGISLRLSLDASGSPEKLFMLDRFSSRVAISAGGLPDRYVAEIPAYCHPTSIRSNHHRSEPNLALEWHITKPEFALIEKHRGNTAPRFDFTFDYTVQQFNKVSGTSHSYVIEEPEGRRAKFSYQPGLEQWIKINRKLRIAELVLFEIPIAVSDSAQGEIDVAIKRAIDFFYHGGSLGFKEVVANIRIAMEKAEIALSIPSFNEGWRKNEATRMERFFLNWYSLKKLTQLAHHEADEWSREEAQYVLTSFLSIINNLSNDGRCMGNE